MLLFLLHRCVACVMGAPPNKGPENKIHNLIYYSTEYTETGTLANSEDIKVCTVS